MRRIQIDTTVEYAEDVDGIIAELNELRATMVSRTKLKDKKKRPKREKLRTKEVLTWGDVFKILRRHHGTDSVATRRTSNLFGMMGYLSYSEKHTYVVRCNECDGYAPKPGRTGDHSLGCPGRSNVSSKILNVTRASLLANYKRISSLPTEHQYHTAIGRRQDMELLVDFLEGKVK